MTQTHKRKPSVSRVCRVCEKCFETTRRQQVFCSHDCSKAFSARGHSERNPRQPLPTNTVGAIAELIVAVDLLRRGYSVFRALSPSCNCDLAVLKNHSLCRVEVKSAYLTVRGELSYPKCDASKFDVIALVRNSQIVYRPDIEEWFEQVK